MAVSSEQLSLTSPPKSAAMAASATRRSTTPWRAATGRFIRSRTGMVGAAALVVIVFGAVFAPWIAPYSPTRQDFRIERQPPSWQHWMGTDEFGRDIFSRIIWGAQASLEAGLVAATIALVIGVLCGMMAAFYGGRTDSLIMRGMDVVLAFPYILLAIAVVAILGPGLRNAMIAIGIVYVPHYARIARGSVLAVRSREYVDAARALGANDARVMRQHILPNTLAPLIVQTTLCVGIAIIDTAGLSFLGLGTQPPTPDWGNMLAAGRNYVIDSPWIATFPGLAILVTVLAFNLVGDALRDAFDPRLR